MLSSRQTLPVDCCPVSETWQQKIRAVCRKIHGGEARLRMPSLCPKVSAREQGEAVCSLRVPDMDAGRAAGRAHPRPAREEVRSRGTRTALPSGHEDHSALLKL